MQDEAVVALAVGSATILGTVMATVGGSLPSGAEQGWHAAMNRTKGSKRTRRNIAKNCTPHWVRFA